MFAGWEWNNKFIYTKFIINIEYKSWLRYIAYNYHMYAYKSWCHFLLTGKSTLSIKITYRALFINLLNIKLRLSFCCNWWKFVCNISSIIYSKMYCSSLWPDESPQFPQWVGGRIRPPLSVASYDTQGNPCMSYEATERVSRWPLSSWWGA